MRQIVVMERVGEPADYRVAFRLTVPVARQPFYANPDAVSAVIGATQAENDALKAGQIVEIVRPFPRNNGVNNVQLRAALEAAHAAAQAEFEANNIWNRYGTSWDGTAWTMVTVA